MKKPKRKQHLVFSALEGISEVPHPPLPSLGALTPIESQIIPSAPEEISQPDFLAEESRPHTVSTVSTGPGSPAADEPLLASPVPVIAGPEPLAEEPPPQVFSAPLSEPHALLPDEIPSVSLAPGILDTDRLADEPLPQIFSNVSTVPSAPAPEIKGPGPLSEEPPPHVSSALFTERGAFTPDETPPASPSPEILVTGPTAEEPRSVTVSARSIRSGVLPNLSFIHIAPGTFFMGSPENEPGRANDEVLHQVTLTKGFALQATLVTQALWLAVMGTNPSEFTQDGHDRPVENVSWPECQEFIQRLNYMGNDHYRLPTEGEWEYACRAATSTACAGGKLVELQGGLDPILDVFGWYCGNSGGTTHPLRQKQPNAWGFYDLHGNVMEWCQDGYTPYGEIRMHKVQGEWVTTTNERIDPVGLPEAKTKIVRGGSWISTARQCRSAARLAWPAEGRTNFIGLRLVRMT